MISCLWAYDGFNNGNYVVEELKKPKQLPKIITMGMLTVTTIYMLVNIACVSQRGAPTASRCAFAPLLMPTDTVWSLTDTWRRSPSTTCARRLPSR